MKRINATALVVVAAVGLVGCTSHKQAKLEANQRWSDTRAGVQLALGEDQFEIGDLDSARSSAAEALSLSPNMTSAMLLMARVAIEKSRYVEADQLLESAYEQEPKRAEVSYLMGVVQERRGNHDKALTLYERARALSPGEAAYVLASAEVLVAMERPVEGLELLESKLPTMNPVASIYSTAGELAMLAGKPGRAVAHYTQARFLAPGNLEIQANLAKAYFFSGQYDPSATIMKRLSQEKDYADSPWLGTMLGESYLMLGQPKQAKACFARMTVLEPRQQRHWVNLAKAALECRDLPRAVLSAQQALRLVPADPEASSVLGYALLVQGEPEAAKKVLAGAIRAHPDRSMLRCLLGRSHSALGEADQATQCYLAALRMDPDSVLAKQLLAGRDGK